ncbi:MAG: InlB B-repeat-containing protein, partial [Clostridia bacterium]|nr:InlB B-repeat-containing protein [Clostridia bacterium]
MQEIQLIFNPGKGTVPLTRITAVVGDRVGAMPKPTRKGYVFTGWYMAKDGDPESPDARRITAETLLDATLFEGEPTDTVLYAGWKKPTAASVAKKKSSLATQKRAIAVLIVLAIVLAAALGAVSVIVDIYEYKDFDGVEYTIKKKKGEYGLYQDGVICDVNNDGYYITNLGTQLDVDPETGEYEIYAVVDTEGTEVVGVQQRVLMFKQLTYDQSSTTDASRVIKRIEVHNQKGEIIVNRGENNRFEVEDHPTAILVDELFAQLSNACGYTISMQRLENPVRLPDGSIDYSEYGLAPEVRTEVDEEGNEILDDEGNPVTYDYVPTWYTVTTMTNESYTVTLGDATVSEAGYYARYGDRDTVYVLSSVNMDAAVLQPVEALITPMMVYPMSLNTYFQVTNFTYHTDIDHDAIYRGMVLELTGLDLDTVTPDENGDYPPEVAELIESASKQIEEMDTDAFAELYERFFEKHSRLVTAFSFIDMDERTDTLYSSLPYQMSSDY